jgi:hypothetical protein
VATEAVVAPGVGLRPVAVRRSCSTSCSRASFAISPDAATCALGGNLGGENLEGRLQLIDAPVGQHVVMFAIRPFWRWQTQGTFILGFNTLMHWNDLNAGSAQRDASDAATRTRGPRASKMSPGISFIPALWMPPDARADHCLQRDERTAIAFGVARFPRTHTLNSGVSGVRNWRRTQPPVQP